MTALWQQSIKHSSVMSNKLGFELETIIHITGRSDGAFSLRPAAMAVIPIVTVNSEPLRTATFGLSGHSCGDGYRHWPTMASLADSDRVWVS